MAQRRHTARRAGRVTPYLKICLDLIVTIGAPAAQFVTQYRKRAFPGIPAAFLAVSGPTGRTGK